MTASRLVFALSLLVMLLGGCIVEEEPCETGQGRCFGTRSIEYCLDGVWQEPERCAPRQMAGGLEILTYCYEDQGVCAP
ncbi:MAG: hypothetical protein KDA24_06410 [Deltaproteobacteria bacterium]|nr:hypothetical protein [Deltaproteobacteria bacterium]